MSEKIKDLNKKVASFMLLSLALSSSAIAGINENLIADAASGISATSSSMSMPVALYGVPTVKPVQVTPQPMPVALYGVPVVQPTQAITPVNPQPMPVALYGVPVVQPTQAITPVNPQPMPVALYGVPVVQPTQAITPVNPQPMPMLLYAPPIVKTEQVTKTPTPQVSQEAIRPEAMPSKNSGVDINKLRTEQLKNTIRDTDSRIPAGYVAPVIMPGYYVIQEKN